MTKRTTNPPKPLLTVSLEEAQGKVFRQLDEGYKILKTEIKTNEEYKQVKKKYEAWNSYTAELLNQIFNTSKFSYEFLGIKGLVLGSTNIIIPLNTEIQKLQEDIQNDLENLDSIYQRLDLFQTTLQLTSQKLNTSPRYTSSSPSITLNNYGTISNPQIQQATSSSSQEIKTDPRSEELKALLNQLTKEVEKLIPHLQGDEKREVNQDLEVFVSEANSAVPREKWWQLSAEGLKKAAKNVGEIGKPILELVERILPLLLMN